MRTAAAYFFIALLICPSSDAALSQTRLTAPRAGPEASYFSVHNLHPAHRITLGSGARVGILDHSFGRDAHPELYAGGKRFVMTRRSSDPGKETHHGYWMALTLREIAPKAEIFALEIPGEEDPDRASGMVDALEWAVENGLDAVTYCGGSLSASERKALDAAVEEAVKSGVVVVFVDYDHPANLLPGGFGPSETGRLRSPDLNIFTYDCTALLADGIVALTEQDDDGLHRRRPFLAHASAGPVTAGLVALLRSVDPEASPSEIKGVLVRTSRPMEYGGHMATRVPDAYEALTSVAGAAFGQ